MNIRAYLAVLQAFARGSMRIAIERDYDRRGGVRVITKQTFIY